MGRVEIVTLTDRPISSSLREVSTWRFREQIARSKKTPALQARSVLDFFASSVEINLSNRVSIALISFIMKFYLIFRVNFLYSKVVFH